MKRLRPVALGLALTTASGVVAAAKPWKPHPVKVIPGVPMRAEDIKPYTPPKLAPEPPLEATDTKVVQITADPEAVINVRPWSSPLLGNAAKGARLPVKGIVKQKSGCKVWYALEPFGYVCNKEAVPTDQPATTEQVLKVREGSRLPFQYVMALIKEGDKIPMWASLDALKRGDEPERQLERGDTVAVEKTYKHDGETYWISVEGKVALAKGLGLMGGGSHWEGLTLDEKTPLPFGWITPDKANAFATPPEKPLGKGQKADAQIARRTRVAIVDERMVGKKKWLKVTIAAPPPPETYGDIMADRAKTAPGATATAEAAPDPLTTMAEIWVAADAVNEVRLLARPKTVPEGVEKWIDVDLGEQVLVAYEKDKPVFATLVSSGRSIPTPMGTYPVWAKAAAITMKSQPYEDKGYFVNKVPWSTFFQWHNAIHGAYWHDKFGVVKSHGCVNVAPIDAKRVFEWVTPAMPPGWTGLRPENLLASPTVVVRNSHAKKEFRQDRPIGPPDKDIEQQRLDEAEKRRADEAQAAAAPSTAAPAPAPAAAPAN